MTRINVVPPSELTDQHLLAEIRELPRVFTLARKRLEKHGKLDLGDIPSEYCLGAGHVKFFFNKLGWIRWRYDDLHDEAENREFKVKYIHNVDKGVKLSCHYYNYHKGFNKALILNRNRLRNKINEKPHFYRYYGMQLEEKI